MIDEEVEERKGMGCYLLLCCTVPIYLLAPLSLSVCVLFAFVDSRLSGRPRKFSWMLVSREGVIPLCSS